MGSTWYLGRLHTDDNQDSDGNQLFTASEEAFALLVVENSYDRWVDIYNREGVPVPKTKGSNGEFKKEPMSEVSPLYTEGGIVFRQGSNGSTGTASGKGWSAEGINRFNTLLRMVVADRIAYPEFNKEFLENEKRVYLLTKVRTRKRKRKEVPSALHELFGSLDCAATINESHTNPAEDAASSSEEENDDENDENDNDKSSGDEDESESDEEHGYDGVPHTAV